MVTVIATAACVVLGEDDGRNEWDAGRLFCQIGKQQMQRAKLAAAMVVAVLQSIMWSDIASARGGGSNFMNSPGYQRRLQESRGYVTNQSGSLFSSPPAIDPKPALRRRRHR